MIRGRRTQTTGGRADYFIGQTGSAQAARDVVAALESAGWTPRDDGWADDGIHSAGLAELARPSFDMPLALLQLVITTVGVLLT